MLLSLLVTLVLKLPEAVCNEEILDSLLVTLVLNEPLAVCKLLMLVSSVVSLEANEELLFVIVLSSVVNLPATELLKDVNSASVAKVESKLELKLSKLDTRVEKEEDAFINDPLVVSNEDKRLF
jgi:hypothetical protein